MKESFWKRSGAYLIAVVLFAAAAAVYCFPALQGKVVNTSDNVNARCAEDECLRYTQETGEVSWWCDSMFGGMPTYQILAGQYKSDRLLSPFKWLQKLGFHSAFWTLLFYFLCFYLLLLSLDTDKWLAIAGAFALTLSSYFLVVIAAGQNNKASSIALTTAVLAGFFMMQRGRYGAGAVLSLIGSAIGVTTHPQMSYYIFMLTGLLWLFCLPVSIKQKRFREFMFATALFAGCVGTGLLANASSVFANTEYASETVRGGSDGKSGASADFVTSFSYGGAESFSLLIPGVQGGASFADAGKGSELYKALIENNATEESARAFCKTAPMYWGGQPYTAGNVYVGAIICFLFLLGLMLVQGPLKWGLLTATVLSVLLALGDNFMPLTQFFMDRFPLYNKFRAVSSILIVAELAMPVLGILAVQKLMDGGIDRKKALRAIFISAGVTAGICLVFAFFGPQAFDFKGAGDAAMELDGWLYEALIDTRMSLLVRDSLRSAFFIAAGAAVLLLFVKDKLSKGWVIAALGMLIVLDLWPVDKRYLNDSHFVTRSEDTRFYEMQAWEETLRDEEGFFRVYDYASGNAFRDSRASLRYASVGGYHAAKLRRYDDLIRKHLSEFHMPVFNMLNTKYILVKGEDGQKSVSINPAALGNAWFVDNISMAQSDEEELDALMKVNLGTTAVVGKEFGHYGSYAMIASGSPDPYRFVKLTSRAPDRREYEYESGTPGTLVFSEVYYPYGWKSSIDGMPVAHFRADYTLRAMVVPAGRHTISFVFDPDSIRKGDAIAIPFVLLIYLIIAAIAVSAVLRSRRRAAGRRSR